MSTTFVTASGTSTPVTTIPASGPAPNPLSGPGSYQAQFNAAYYASKPPAFAAFYQGRPGGAPGLPISQTAAWALAAQLMSSGAIVDEEIDAEGMDPYTTMFMRQLYGQTWEPSGLGSPYSTEVVTPGEYTGPVPAGAIKVSTLISDFPPYPVPPAPPATNSTTLAPNPVGVRIIQYNQANEIGDVFRCAVANDGYADGATWTGMSSSGISGTFTKSALEMGMMICWVKTA